MKKLFCNLLMVLMAWTPYQFAQAGMIGTDQAVSAASQSDRSAVLGYVSRADVASQLQSFGIDPVTAGERVAAMSDGEVKLLAGQIDALPAGANNGGLLIVILIIAALWWVWKS